MKILLTGASSYVGARLFLDLKKSNNILGTFSGNQLSEKFVHLDVTDPEEVKKVLTANMPDVIIHAAASADARWCEANPAEAFKLNREATLNIVNVANDIGSKVIFISTFAAINPVNVYGRTKRESEAYVRQVKNGYIILRPSLIIGYSPNTTNDRPFNRILKNLDQKTEAIYDTSWKFQPTFIRHISEIIQEILEKKINNEIIPIAAKDLKTRFDIARDILDPFRIEVTPIDKQDSTPVIIDNLEKLFELNLTKYTYREIISEIIGEIKNREIYSNV
jgi:dTDP-4-dehydrorhamnose reductase